MTLSIYQKQRLACAYYFFGTGLSYGIFTSRMPAFKAQVGANDAEIGLLLLAFGGFSFIGLLVSNFFISRFGARAVSAASIAIFSFALCIAGLTHSIWSLGAWCALAGIGTGFCDVSMNTQGIMIENQYHVRTLAFLHATFSLGGVSGSLAGSLFAALNSGTFLNMAVCLGLWLCLWLPAFGHAIRGGHKKAAKEGNRLAIPLFVVLCGCMSTLCYASEGSVGEWGSLLLHSVKGASQEQAALVFGCFSTMMVICRFSADYLRGRFGDFGLVFFGSLLAGTAMIVVLLASNPWICLGAYACMGIGFAPIVPILYSRAGSIPGLSAARASSFMSLVSYTGLLFFPPLLGFLAQTQGLDNALWLIVIACFLVTAGSFGLRKKT